MKKVAHITQNNYVKLTYTLPNADGWYNYTGISQTTSESNEPLASLIGMSDSNSAKGSQLTDLYWVGTDQSALFGVMCGGRTNSTTYAGALACAVSSTIASLSAYAGFRMLLF